MLLTKVTSQIHKLISLLQHMWISSSINCYNLLAVVVYVQTVSVVRQPVEVIGPGGVGGSWTSSSSGVSSLTGKRMLGALESQSNVSTISITHCLSSIKLCRHIVRPLNSTPIFTLTLTLSA